MPICVVACAAINKVSSEARPRDDEIRTLEVLKETIWNTDKSPLLIWYANVIWENAVVP